MTKALNEADHELRSLLRFASGLSVDGATVFEIYGAVCQEADVAGDVSTEERLAEVRRRLVRTAGLACRGRRVSRFRLHRGWREADGLVTDHVTLGRTIEAATAYDAMAAALAEGDFLVTEDTNLAWVTDEHDGLIWSLRLDDEDTVPRA